MLGILIITHAKVPPTASQRRQASTLVEFYPETFRGVALLTNSVVARGALLAINWLISKKHMAVPFAPDDLDGALAFLKLSDPQKKEVRELLAVLDPRG